AEIEPEVALHVAADVLFLDLIVVADRGFDAGPPHGTVVEVEQRFSGVDVRHQPRRHAARRQTQAVAEGGELAVVGDRRGRDVGGNDAFLTGRRAVGALLRSGLEGELLPLRPKLDREGLIYVPLEVQRRILEAVDGALRTQAD